MGSAALAISGAVLAAETPELVETATESFDLTESLEISQPAVSDVAVTSVGRVSEPEANLAKASHSSSEDVLAQISAYHDVVAASVGQVSEPEANLAKTNHSSSEEILAQISAYHNDVAQLAQVTRVSELSDVQPSDWAYTALRRLVEEYGCMEGYPNRTFRGRVVSCFQRIIYGLRRRIISHPFGINVLSEYRRPSHYIAQQRVLMVLSLGLEFQLIRPKMGMF